MSLKPLKPVKKAYVYMVRRQHLLVHEHVDYPEMPLALPGGTLEPGELPPLAAWRESVEETGLCGGFGNLRLIGTDVQVHPKHRLKVNRYTKCWLLKMYIIRVMKSQMSFMCLCF